MNITADTVKQLRERTGAGMMECKKALVETQGDLDAAAELMRKTGLAKADKKAARIAAEGTVAASAAATAPCWWKSIARPTSWRAARILELRPRRRAGRPRQGARRRDALMALMHGASSLEEQRRALIAKIGENIS